MLLNNWTKGLILVIFIVIGWFGGCIGPTQYIDAIKVDETPDDYYNMSEQQMDEYPHLKEAILSGKGIETPLDEFDEVKKLLEDQDTDFIKYQDEYYEIGFVCAD